MYIRYLDRGGCGGEHYGTVELMSPPFSQLWALTPPGLLRDPRIRTGQPILCFFLTQTSSSVPPAVRPPKSSTCKRPSIPEKRSNDQPWLEHVAPALTTIPKSSISNAVPFESTPPPGSQFYHLLIGHICVLLYCPYDLRWQRP